MKEMHLFMDTAAPPGSDGVFTLNLTHNQLCLAILSISTVEKRNPSYVVSSGVLLIVQ